MKCMVDSVAGQIILIATCEVSNSCGDGDAERLSALRIKCDALISM